jgi:hypothetical protein
MSLSNRAFALNYLGEYQRASLIPSVMVLESYLDSKYPGFLDLWGSAVRNLNSDSVREKLRELARRNGMSYPTRTELNQIILDVPRASLSTAIAQGTSEAVTELGEAAGSALKFGLPVLILGGAVFLAWRMGVFSRVTARG